MIKRQNNATQKKRIIIISSQAFSLLQFRLDMMVRFHELGYDVYAIAPDNDLNIKKKLTLNKIKYYSFKLQRNGLNIINDIESFFQLKTIIAKLKPDVVFSYQAKTIVYGTIAAYVCGVRDIYCLIAGLGTVYRSKKYNIKNEIIKIVLNIQYKIALKIAKKVIFQNHDDSSLFINAKLVSKIKVKYMNGSGVNIDHFKHQPVPPKKTILFIGRYIRDKGICEYLKAARKVKSIYPEVEFQIIGYHDTNPSSLKKEFIKPYIDEGSVVDYGKVEDTYPYIRDCYIFVLPSYHEGTPKSVLEAMAVGRAIITTNVPGCKETVIDGVNGFIVEPKSASQIAEKIKFLIENEQIAIKMGEKSYEIAREKYDVKKINETLIKDLNL